MTAIFIPLARRWARASSGALAWRGGPPLPAKSGRFAALSGHPGVARPQARPNGRLRPLTLLWAVFRPNRGRSAAPAESDRRTGPETAVNGSALT